MDTKLNKDSTSDTAKAATGSTDQHSLPEGSKGGSQQADPDAHKGAIEDNRPSPGPDRRGTPGLDENGLPNDPVAIAQDREGANIDKSQG